LLKIPKTIYRIVEEVRTSFCVSLLRRGEKRPGRLEQERKRKSLFKRARKSGAGEGT
jgi:hypothetical protein